MVTAGHHIKSFAYCARNIFMLPKEAAFVPRIWLRDFRQQGRALLYAFGAVFAARVPVLAGLEC